MRYNNRISMRDLFMNPELAHLFPQFDTLAVRNVYSFAETEKRVLEYLKNAFNGIITGDGELLVYGKHKKVLRQVKALKTAIENLINSIPSIGKNLRRDTKLYLPYANLEQLKNIQDPAAKLDAINALIENINYNPDFQSLNRLPSNSALPFSKRQEQWKKRVGYKEQA